MVFGITSARSRAMISCGTSGVIPLRINRHYCNSSTIANGTATIMRKVAMSLRLGGDKSHLLTGAPVISRRPHKIAYSDSVKSAE